MPILTVYKCYHKDVYLCIAKFNPNELPFYL